MKNELPRRSPKEQPLRGRIIRSLSVIAFFGVVGGMIPNGCIGWMAFSTLRSGEDLPTGEDVNLGLACLSSALFLVGGLVGSVIGTVLVARKKFYKYERFRWEE